MTTSPNQPAASTFDSPAAGTFASPSPAPSRRQMLVAAGLGAGALGLAACGSSSPAAASAASTSTSTSTAAAAAAAAGSAPAGGSALTGNTLVPLGKVPVGGAVAVTDANGKPIIVAQPTAGKVTAFSALCTHKGCAVAVKAAELDCPCHGSKFNALTGAVLQGPAAAPLPSVAVQLSGDNVVAG